MIPYHDSPSRIQFLDNGVVYVCIRGNASASIPANCHELSSHEVRALLRVGQFEAHGRRCCGYCVSFDFPVTSLAKTNSVTSSSSMAFESGRYSLLRERRLRGLHPAGVKPEGEDLVPEDWSDEAVSAGSHPMTMFAGCRGASKVRIFLQPSMVPTTQPESSLGHEDGASGDKISTPRPLEAVPVGLMGPSMARPIPKKNPS